MPENLRRPQENEEQEIKRFWDNEVIKCNYVKERRVRLQEQWQEQVKAIAVAKAVEEAKKEQGEEIAQIQEEKDEADYEALLLTMKAKLNLISQE